MRNVEAVQQMIDWMEEHMEEVPASDYLVFSYPVFDFMAENADVMGAVENLAFFFNPAEMGYEWNEEECQIYQ